MKLVIVIIQEADSKRVVNALNEAKIAFTKLATKGGFLNSGNSTFLIGIKENKIDNLLQLIKDNSQTRKSFVTGSMATSLLGNFPEQPIEVEVGGATVFILPMEKMIHF